MSTDFSGIEPASEAGRHLNMNTWTLRPLDEFLEYIATNVKDGYYNTWNYNTDEDWTKEDAEKLAVIIRQNVENGHALQWAKARGKPAINHQGITVYTTCCEHHFFHPDVATQFAAFLEASGGFTVT